MAQRSGLMIPPHAMLDAATVSRVIEMAW